MNLVHILLFNGSAEQRLYYNLPHDLVSCRLISVWQNWLEISRTTEYFDKIQNNSNSENSKRDWIVYSINKLNMIELFIQ